MERMSISTRSGDKAAVLIIFAACFVVRTIFVLFSGYDNFQLQPDTLRYDRQSDLILSGSYNLIEPLFITAPVYPYFVALFKLIFASYWIDALQWTQVTIASISGIFIYKIAKLIWQRIDIAVAAAAIFCLYPFTFWWVHTFSQDMLFQCLFIFSIYFLLKAAYEDQIRYAVIFAVIFSLTFLTKSHILIFSPFAAAFILWARPGEFRRRLVSVGAVAAICFVFTLPYGLYNLSVNGVYVFSSTGQGGHFLTGHNDDIYSAVVDPPPMGTDESQRLLNLDYQVFKDLESQKDGLSHSEVQSLFFREGLRWIRENPAKAATLAAYNAYYFIMPGLNPNWYSRSQWLASLAIAVPIYLLAYYGIFIMLRRDLRRHFWIFALFLSMMVFSVGFYVQNRFRTITIEPFYIVFAAFPATSMIRLLFDGILSKGATEAKHS